MLDSSRLKAPRKAALAVVVGFLAAACAGSQAAEPAPASPPPPTPEATAPPAPAPAPTSAKIIPPAVAQAPYGKADGKDLTLFTLTNSSGLVLKVTNYGCIVTELHVPDKAGKLADVVLGFETVEGYQKGSPYFGATVGRIANRIRGAKFKLEGKDYKLAANDGQNHLHGGVKGWDKVVWDAAPTETPDGPSITFTYVSKDGEEGYPGTVTAKTIYTLTNKNELRVEMVATTDKTTIVNMRTTRTGTSAGSLRVPSWITSSRSMPTSTRRVIPWCRPAS
jgi:aldose 1-epimerase